MAHIAWHHCHNEAFKRLGGIAAINRIDNLKTGVAKGSCVWRAIRVGFSTNDQQLRQAAVAR